MFRKSVLASVFVLLALAGLSVVKAQQADQVQPDQVQPSLPPSSVQFNLGQPPNPVRGQPYAYSLCSGSPVDTSKGLTPSIDANLCDSSSATVSGGSAPYHFQMEPGSFLPLGLHLGLNGVIYGKPSAPKSKLATTQTPPTICAVDLGGNQSCQQVALNLADPKGNNFKSGHSHTGLIVGASAIGGAAVIGGVVAAKAIGNNYSSGGSSSCTQSAPQQCGAFGPGDPPGCLQGQAFVNALSSYCSCNGFSSGYSLGAGYVCP